MSILKEFREFAIKGNVVDMAVGIIIGGAFGTIVSIAGEGRSHAAHWNDARRRRFLRHQDSLEVGFSRAGAVTVNIGTFINNVISFAIVALAVFALVKAINELQEALRARGRDGAGTSPAVGNLPEGNPRRAGEEVGHRPPHRPTPLPRLSRRPSRTDLSRRTAAAAQNTELRAVRVAKLYGAGRKHAAVGCRRLGKRCAHLEGWVVGNERAGQHGRPLGPLALYDHAACRAHHVARALVQDGPAARGDLGHVVLAVHLWQQHQLGRVGGIDRPAVFGDQPGVARARVRLVLAPAGASGDGDAKAVL